MAVITVTGPNTSIPLGDKIYVYDIEVLVESFGGGGGGGGHRERQHAGEALGT